MGAAGQRDEAQGRDLRNGKEQLIVLGNVPAASSATSAASTCIAGVNPVEPAARESLGLLLARQGRFVGGKIVQAMAATGLTPRHRAVLAELSRRGPTSQQDLIGSLSVDPNVLVSVLNDLERRNLAERRRDPTDRRRHVVEMSVQGSEVLCRIETAISQAEAWLFADLDADDGERLRALLGKVCTP